MHHLPDVGWRVPPLGEHRRQPPQIGDRLQIIGRLLAPVGPVEIRPDPDMIGIPGDLADVVDMIADSLDPHSEFLEAKDNEQFEEELTGQFGGIGIQVESRGGRIVVIAPIAGTPSERAGIRRSDEIVSIDGKPDIAAINKFVDNDLLSKDSMALRSYIKTIAPELDMGFDFVCEHCGEVERMDVPMTVQFFWPES